MEAQDSSKVLVKVRVLNGVLDFLIVNCFIAYWYVNIGRLNGDVDYWLGHDTFNVKDKIQFLTSLHIGYVV